MTEGVANPNSPPLPVVPGRIPQPPVSQPGAQPSQPQTSSQPAPAGPSPYADTLPRAAYLPVTAPPASPVIPVTSTPPADYTGSFSADALAAAVEGYLARGISVGVLTINYSGLKWTNDNLAHDAGNAFLKEARIRLAEALGLPVEEISIYPNETSTYRSGPNYGVVYEQHSGESTPEYQARIEQYLAATAEVFSRGIDFCWSMEMATADNPAGMTEAQAQELVRENPGLTYEVRAGEGMPQIEFAFTYSAQTEGRPGIFNQGVIFFNADQRFTHEAIVAAFGEQIYYLNRPELQAGRHGTVFEADAEYLGTLSLADRLVDYDRFPGPAPATDGAIAVEPRSGLRNAQQLELDGGRRLQENGQVAFAFIDGNAIGAFRSLGPLGEIMINAILEQGMPQVRQILGEHIELYRATSGSEEFYLLGDGTVTQAQMEEAMFRFIDFLASPPPGTSPIRVRVEVSRLQATEMGRRYLSEFGAQFPPYTHTFENGREVVVMDVDVRQVLRGRGALFVRGLTGTAGVGMITAAAPPPGIVPEEYYQSVFRAGRAQITDWGEIAKDLDPARVNIIMLGEVEVVVAEGVRVDAQRYEELRATLDGLPPGRRAVIVTRDGTYSMELAGGEDLRVLRVEGELQYQVVRNLGERDGEAIVAEFRFDESGNPLLVNPDLNAGRVERLPAPTANPARPSSIATPVVPGRNPADYGASEAQARSTESRALSQGGQLRGGEEYSVTRGLEAARSFTEDTRFGDLLERTIERIRRLPEGERLRILTIGPGLGNMEAELMRRLAERGLADRVVIDTFSLTEEISPENRRYIRDEYVGNIDYNQLPRGREGTGYDLVLSFNGGTLWAQDQTFAVQQVYDALAPGGEASLTVLNNNPIANRVGQLAFSSNLRQVYEQDGLLLAENHLTFRSRQLYMQRTQEAPFDFNEFISSEGAGGHVFYYQETRNGEWLQAADANEFQQIVRQRMQEAGLNPEESTVFTHILVVVGDDLMPIDEAIAQYLARRERHTRAEREASAADPDTSSPRDVLPPPPNFNPLEDEPRMASGRGQRGGPYYLSGSPDGIVPPPVQPGAVTSPAAATPGASAAAPAEPSPTPIPDDEIARRQEPVVEYVASDGEPSVYTAEAEPGTESTTVSTGGPTESTTVSSTGAETIPADDPILRAFTEGLEGIKLTDGAGQALEGEARLARITELSIAAKASGFMAMDFSALRVAGQEASVDADKLLEFVSGREPGARLLVAATPEEFYSIGGFRGSEGLVCVRAADGAYHFVDAEGTLLASYEMRDGYRLEQTYRIEEDASLDREARVRRMQQIELTERLERDIAPQARQMEFRILEPVYRQLGRSEIRISVARFLAEHPRPTAAVSGVAATGVSLGVGSLGAAWAEGLLDALGIVMPALRFIIGFAGFDLFARLPNFVLTGQTAGGLSVRGLPHLGVFHLASTGYQVVLNLLGISEDSILSSGWVSLPVGALASHLLFSAFQTSRGGMGYLARMVERVLPGRGAAFGVAGASALQYLGEAGVILMLNSVMGDTAGWIYSQVSDEYAARLQQMQAVASEMSPQAYETASLVFGQTYGAMLIDGLDRAFVAMGIWDEDESLRALYDRWHQQEQFNAATFAQVTSQQVWTNICEVYTAYLATHPLYLEEAALRDNLRSLGYSDEEIMEKVAQYEQEYMRQLEETLYRTIADNPQLKEHIQGLLRFYEESHITNTTLSLLLSFFDETGTPILDRMPDLLTAILSTNLGELSIPCSDGETLEVPGVNVGPMVEDIFAEQQRMLACEMFLRLSQGVTDLRTFEDAGFVTAEGEPDFTNPYVRDGFRMFMEQNREMIVARALELLRRVEAGQNIYTSEELDNTTGANLMALDRYLGLVIVGEAGEYTLNLYAQEGTRDTELVSTDWLSQVVSDAAQRAHSPSETDETERPGMIATVREIIADIFTADPEVLLQRIEELNLNPEAVERALAEMVRDGSLLRLARARGERDTDSAVEDHIFDGRYRLLYMLYSEEAPDSIPLMVLRAYLYVLETADPSREGASFEDYNDSWLQRGEGGPARSYYDQFITARTQLLAGQNVEENELLLSSLFFKAGYLNPLQP